MIKIKEEMKTKILFVVIAIAFAVGCSNSDGISQEPITVQFSSGELKSVKLNSTEQIELTMNVYKITNGRCEVPSGPCTCYSPVNSVAYLTVLVSGSQTPDSLQLSRGSCTGLNDIPFSQVIFKSVKGIRFGLSNITGHDSTNFSAKIFISQ